MASRAGRVRATARRVGRGPARWAAGGSVGSPAVSDIDRLVDLQKAADTEHAKLRGLDGEEHREQWERWRTAAETIQAAITEAAEGGNRYELEAKVKKAARHVEPEG